MAALRKSAFGRTSIFTDVDPRTSIHCVRTASAATQRIDGALYHDLADASKRVETLCCWHCCEPMDPEGPHFAIPKTFNAAENMFYVYGHFDCLACCKAYIMAESGFDRGHQVNTFMQMAREVYACSEDIVEAPPRVSLRKFGGPFDMDEFRQKPTVARVVSPPFVSYCMLAEECATHNDEYMRIGEVDDDVFAEPAPVSLYDEFCAQDKGARNAACQQLGKFKRKK